MEILATMDLESTLSTILANFFGTTTEVIMQNLPIWLSKYGWFLCIQNIGLNFLFGVFLSLLFTGLMIFVTSGFFEIQFYKKNIKWFVLIFLLMAITPCAISIISCMVAPEFYAFSNIMNIISN